MAFVRAVALVAVLATALPWNSSRAQASPPEPPAPPQGAQGRIAGRVVNAVSGQPLPQARVQVVDRPYAAIADLDGRYTILGVPVGKYSIKMMRIGYQPKQFDSIAVTASEAAIVNFSAAEVSLELQSVVVQAARTDRAATDVSMLAMQQRAAAVSDGISAEQIRRSPDSNAGEAATRVSGVSVVDSKFVIARGLPERYSATLVNGVEVASPEPTKKLVPLDIFPASLLESIVVTKSATPDKPGDFSGGAVEVKTKEFPDNNVLQFNVSQGFNSQATLETLPFPHRRGMDYLGFDGGRREAHYPRNPGTGVFAEESAAEAFRNEWNPSPRRTLPNLGAGLNVGGQIPSERTPLGYVVSLTYSANSEHQPDRFFQFFSDPNADANRGYVYQDYRTVVDWGGVANVSLKLGPASKLGWKNLYTRNAEELYSTSEGFSVDRNGDVRAYQFQYVERNLQQSQLSGEHLLEFLGSSRLEWKATVSRSARNEPDNRQVMYLRGSDTSYKLGTNSDLWVRHLDDRQTSAQVDWQIPLQLLSRDVRFKTGGLMRNKQRAFDARLASFSPHNDAPEALTTLPPHLLFTPENLGAYVGISFPGTSAQPYDADDDLRAAYAMIDTEILPRVRFVGGARLEDWSIDLFDGGRETYAAGDTARRPTMRRNRDLLWSANSTVSLSERLNLRLGVFQSVSRPDTRELSPDEYVDVVGSCATIGNPNLERTTALNADARLEWYPRPGEVVSVSGFFKEFDAPIIRTVMGRNGCTYTYENALSATNYGAEFDVRQDLTYLPGILSRLSAGANFTYVHSRVVIDPVFGTYDPDLALEGQSPYLVNASVSYYGRSAFNATLLYNLFGDRIVRYGFRSGGGDGSASPNVVEQGRGTVDFKLQRGLGRSTITIAAKNLTNAPVRFVQDIDTGTTSTGYAKPGVTFQIGFGYAR